MKEFAVSRTTGSVTETLLTCDDDRSLVELLHEFIVGNAVSWVGMYRVIEDANDPSAYRCRSIRPHERITLWAQPVKLGPWEEERTDVNTPILESIDRFLTHTYGWENPRHEERFKAAQTLYPNW